MAMQKAAMAYHHGDAKAALLEAAAELLETDGAAGLSLRQLAERAGLSRQAPYNHFADKEALLAELVRAGYARLGKELGLRQRSGASPLAQLARAAEIYIAFGQRSPALFRLMFGKEFVDLSRHPSARKAATSAFAQLSAIVARFTPVPSTSDPSTPDVTLVAWSLVHGYTSLCLETGLESAGRRRQRALLFARTVDALIRARVES